LEGLFYALEKQSYTLNWPKDPKANVVIVVDSQETVFRLSETIEQKTHVLTKQEAERRKNNQYDYSPKWDYFGTRRLRLSIENVPYGARKIRKFWGDAKTQQLESFLGDFIVTLPRIAAAIKFRNEERERQHQQWQEQQKRAEDERRRQAEYGRKIQVVGKLAAAWREVSLLREFAQVLKQGSRSPVVPVEQKLVALRVVDWTERLANSLDPLIDIAWVIRQFDKRSD
jgi:hypothetical protein